jgi:uncharacterized protein YbcI
LALDRPPVTLSLAAEAGSGQAALADVPPQGRQTGSAGGYAAQISTAIAGLLRERTGRGPTKARAIVSSDLVLVTMTDSYTALERQLATLGNEELVVRGRRAIHSAIRAEASAIVEDLTDKQVTAYLTAQQDSPDIAILVFYLAPLPPRAVP